MRAEYVAPGGAGDFLGVAGYKDFAPDGAAANRNAVASFSLVAADVSRIKLFRAGIGAESRPLLQTIPSERRHFCWWPC